MNQDLINTLLGIGAAICGWFMRVVWQSMRDLQTADKELTANIAQLREHLPVTYVSKAEFREALREINLKLDRIYERLENKQDRSNP